MYLPRFLLTEEEEGRCGWNAHDLFSLCLVSAVLWTLGVVQINEC